jgi:hypothetical protein
MENKHGSLFEHAPPAPARSHKKIRKKTNKKREGVKLFPLNLRHNNPAQRQDIEHNNLTAQQDKKIKIEDQIMEVKQ